MVVFDRNRDKLARIRAMGDNVTVQHAYTDSIARADLRLGAVPRTASQALSAAILPWSGRLTAGDGCQLNRELSAAINVEKGKVAPPALLV